MSIPSIRRTDSCPLCGRPAVAPHAPFCCQGCRDRDLLQWLGEGYRIPAAPANPDDEESAGIGLDSSRGRPL